MSVLTGGVGHAELRQFYATHFIPKMPPDMEMAPLSRTIGTEQLVDEMVVRFTHTVEMDWMPALVSKQIEFFEGGRAEIEAAIAAGRVERPEARINGELVWEWPQGNAWLGRT